MPTISPRSIGGRFSSIEEIEGRDLFSFINQVERERTNQARLKKLIAFARSCMTAVSASLTAATSRGEHTPIRGNTRNPVVTIAANAYFADPCSANMAGFLTSLKGLSDVRVIRADLFNRMTGVLHKHILYPELTLREAAEQIPFGVPLQGAGPSVAATSLAQPFSSRDWNSTTPSSLTQGSLARKELYVALTRGARSLTIISSTATLNPVE